MSRDLIQNERVENQIKESFKTEAKLDSYNKKINFLDKKNLMETFGSVGERDDLSLGDSELNFKL